MFTPEDIGISFHRLALAYGESGKYEQARSLLRAALYQFERGEQFGQHHPFVLVALDDLETYAKPETDEENEQEELEDGSPPSPPNSARRRGKKIHWSSLSSLPIQRIDEDSQDRSPSPKPAEERSLRVTHSI